MATAETLYVITSFIWDDDYEREGVREPEVYTTKSAANVAARKLMKRFAGMLSVGGDDEEGWEYCHNLDDDGLYRGTLTWEGGHTAVEMCIYEVKLNRPSAREWAKRPIPGPGNWVHGGDENADNDDDDDNDDKSDGEESGSKGPWTYSLPKPKSSASRSDKTKTGKTTKVAKAAVNPTTNRKTIPEGIPNCLEGLKILFTGTFDTMDRVTSVATANKYGAKVVTKLENTDYVVLGQRAGPKKLQTINELGLETINEEEFFEILENGISSEKKKQMAKKRKADGLEEVEESEGLSKKKRSMAGKKKTGT